MRGVETPVFVSEPCAIHRFGAARELKVREFSAFSASSLDLAAAIADTMELNSALEIPTVQACGMHTVETRIYELIAYVVMHSSRGNSHVLRLSSCGCRF